MTAEIIDLPPQISDSLYLRLSEEAPALAGQGRTSITRTIETSDESAGPVELIGQS